MRAALKSRGTRLTPRRDKMLEVLVSSERHPSAGEIHEEVKRYHPRTSLATIYNTIELLKDAGQLLEIEFSGAANRYDGRRHHHHPHLICLECEKIEDLESIDHDEPLDDLSRVNGYEITGRRMDYYGVCPDCQSDADPATNAPGKPERRSD